MRQMMGSFLTLEDKSALIRTCKELYYKGIGREVRVNRLLSLVAQGRQDEAEAMIKQDPTLLLARGDVTDGAGRTFRGITALQYAVWALDAHMWTMMLPHFDCISAPGSAGDQLRALEEKGLDEHGSHFDFKPLLNAYGAYIAFPTEKAWCWGIGRQQRLLPDPVIQEYMMRVRSIEYTMLGRSWFFEVSDFRVHTGRPNLPDSDGEQGANWWRTAEYYGGRMGATWAATVSPYTDYIFPHDGRPDKWSNEQPWEWRTLDGKPLCGPRIERGHFRALCSQRRQDLSDLLASFGIKPSQAPDRKSPGPGR
jgi:hypothetical protein